MRLPLFVAAEPHVNHNERNLRMNGGETARGSFTSDAACAAREQSSAFFDEEPHTPRTNGDRAQSFALNFTLT